MSESESNPTQKSDEEVKRLLQEALKKSGGKRGGDQRPVAEVGEIVLNIVTEGKVWEKRKKPKAKKKKDE